MLEGLPIELIGTLTPSALLGVCVLFILIGRLVPLKSHKRELCLKDQQIEYLRTALDICQKSAQRRTDQVTELLEHSRITTAIIKSLPHVDQGNVDTTNKEEVLP